MFVCQIDFLARIRNDSASICLEKLKQHVKERKQKHDVRIHLYFLTAMLQQYFFLVAFCGSIPIILASHEFQQSGPQSGALAESDASRGD